MLHKQINLLLVSVLIIILTMQIPVYNKWYNSKILSGAGLDYQLNHMGLEDRLRYRFGVPYSIYKAVESTIRQAKAVNAIVLLPPTGWIKEMKPTNDFNGIEPAIFYYFTGLKGVTTSSPDVMRADWIMVIDNHKVGLKKVLDTAFLKQYITEFKKYDQ